MKIRDVYFENKYRLFVQYCEEQDIQQVEQLRHFNFYQLYQVQGIGEKKINEIFEKYKKYESDKSKNKTSQTGFDDELARMNEDFLNAPIAVLELFGVKTKIIAKLVELDCRFVNDLQKNIFDMKLNPNYFKKIQQALKKVSSNYHEILDYVVKQIRQDNYAHLFEARVAGETLESIGNREHFTRERARQILKKFSHEMDLFLRILYHHRSLKYNREIIPMDKVYDLIQGLNFDDEVLYAIQNLEDEVYLEFCQKILITGASKKEVYKKLDNIAKEYRLAYHGEKDYRKIIKTILLKYECRLSVDDFLLYTESKGYKLIQGYLLKKMKPHLVACIEIVKDSFKNGIKVYDNEQIELLKTLVKKKYPEIKFPANDRTLSTRLAEELILCKRGTYIHRSHVEASVEIIEEVCEYIDNSDKQRILYSEIFEVFHDRLLEETTIDNRDYLHGLLLHYFPKRYHYERDYVGKSAKTNETTAVHLTQFLQNADGPASIGQVQSAIKGISKAMIYNIIAKTDDIIHWENNYFLGANQLEVTTQDKEILKKILDESLAQYNDYSNEVLVYDAVLIKYPEFLSRNHIDKAVNIFYVLQLLFRNDYYFRKPHILKYAIDANECVMRNKIKEKLGDSPYFNYHEFFNYGKALKWNEQTIYALHRTMMAEYYHLDEDISVKREEIKLTEADQKLMKKLIEKQIKREKYIALINGFNFTGFPKIEFKWTTHLLEDILGDYDLGYECINFQRKDRRIQKSVMVRKKDHIKTLEDLIILIYGNELNNGVFMNAVNEYLKKNYIVFDNYKFSTTDINKLKIMNDKLYFK